MNHRRSPSALLLWIAVIYYVCSPCSGFAPSPHRSQYVLSSRTSTTSTCTTKRTTTLLSAGALEEVTESLDDFDNYQQTSTQKMSMKDTVVGDGAMAENGNVITVAYEGRLLSTGKQFDEGIGSFRLGDGKVIPGWEQGLQGMRVGGKRTLRIPPSLAYERGARDKIPPNSHLEFDCELTGIAEGAVEEAFVQFKGRIIYFTGVLLAIMLAASTTL